jgi:hypothetical protein
VPQPGMNLVAAGQLGFEFVTAVIFMPATLPLLDSGSHSMSAPAVDELGQLFACTTR